MINKNTVKPPHLVQHTVHSAKVYRVRAYTVRCKVK